MEQYVQSLGANTLTPDCVNIYNGLFLYAGPFFADLDMFIDYPYMLKGICEHVMCLLEEKDALQRWKDLHGSIKCNDEQCTQYSKAKCAIFDHVRQDMLSGEGGSDPILNVLL